jgi:endo-beta-N-acetylglucosaminidase D
LTTPLLASDPVTVVIEETTIEQKTNLFVYGYAEGVDRRQEVSITLSDRNAKTLELTAEINKIGNWGVEEVDISTLSDGKIAIAAAIIDDAGIRLARTNSTAVLDTSFNLCRVHEKAFCSHYLFADGLSVAIGVSHEDTPDCRSDTGSVPAV